MESTHQFKTFGERLRQLRENADLTLKIVSESICIDMSLLAKIERNERQPTKAVIRQLSEFFNVDERELFINLLSDQIAYKILDEEADVSVLKIAEEKIKYLKNTQHEKGN